MDAAGVVASSATAAQFMDLGAWLDPTSGNASLLGALMNSAWLTDKERRDLEYRKYKELNQQGYKRDEDPCKNLRNRIEYMKKLALARHSWDMRWMTPKYPGGRHAAVNARDWAELKILEERLRRECPDECN